MRKQIRRKSMLVVLLTALFVSQLQTVSPEAAKLAKPSVTVSKRTKKTATLKIKSVKKATGYQVYIANSKNGKYKQAGATRTTKFQVLKLKSSKTYYVKVRAYRTSGNRIVTGRFSKIVKIEKFVKQSTADKYAQEILTLVNQERSKEGLDALKLDNKLNEAACTRAKELVESFSHTRPDGRTCYTVLTDMDIVYSAVGENIAAGRSTSSEVMDDWMNSDGHRANILKSDYTKMGVGYYKASSGYKYYWVQIFVRE